MRAFRKPEFMSHGDGLNLYTGNLPSRRRFVTKQSYFPLFECHEQAVAGYTVADVVAGRASPNIYGQRKMSHSHCHPAADRRAGFGFS